MSIHKNVKECPLIFAKRVLLESGWAENVRIGVEGGTIRSVTIAAQPGPADAKVDTLLPALANVHSHCFQRAMAGQTEVRARGRDSFWTWRELMYRFVEQITPEQYEAIAAMVFVEMLEAGYASVGEFHYVHHQRDGVGYVDIAELSNRVYAAAAATGIGLTHLPVLYTYGGAGQVALSQRQLRFGTDVDQFMRLHDRAKSGLSHLPADCTLGMAPHSLRATCPEDLSRVLVWREGGPVHIHVAEQPQEVRDIQDWLGARPVEWLLEECHVNSDWCLVHATHMTDDETVGMARSGAIAGLCPITEANLGDGPFNGPGYLRNGGAFGIGSDSNINISMVEELRTLEYSQRLRDLSRNVMIDGEGSVGQALYCKAAQGGAVALGRLSGKIKTGYLADVVAIDGNAPCLCTLRPEQLLDGLVFAGKDRVVTDVWSAGRHGVVEGRHIARERVIGNYRSAMKTLLARV
jgi:formimidoylglutamate deiminase